MNRITVWLAASAVAICMSGTAFAAAETKAIPIKILSYEDGTLLIWLDRVIPCGDGQNATSSVSYPSNRGTPQGRAQMLTLLTAAMLSKRYALFDTDGLDAKLGSCTGYAAVLVDENHP